MQAPKFIYGGKPLSYLFAVQILPLIRFGKKFGREIIAVPPHFTSIECSSCGALVQKSLSTRTHSCPRCGYIEQRDVNAAKVILSRASATGGHPGSNASRDVLSASIGRKTCKSKERQ